MKAEKTIFVFIDWFLPGTKAGGPVQSLFGLIESTKNKFYYKIFTSNVDHLSTEPYKNILSNQWIRFCENAEVYYCSKENINKKTVKNILSSTAFDKIYINSFYSPMFSIMPVKVIRSMNLSSQTILAVRGMLGKGALNVKPLKKKAFIFYSKLVGFHKNILFQASSENEEKDIRNVFGDKVKVKIAGNLPSRSIDKFYEHKKLNGELNLFFLSRIVAIKNIKYAIQLLKNVSPLYKINYTIYGFIEDKHYWEECLTMAKKLPNHVQFIYGGELMQQQISNELNKHHALLMPTLNENFGHAIFESFSSGCLAIISDQTPWKNLRENGLGMDFHLSEPFSKEAVEYIETCAKMTEEEWNLLAKKAYDFAVNYKNSSPAIKDNIDLFG